MASYGLTRRGIKLLRFLSLVSIGLLIYIRWHDIFPQPGPPPLYEEARESENSLPHYNDYEHKTVKYLLAANHFHSSGWGNIMQDYVMMGLLAHSTNRSFVFNDYVWNRDGSLYSEYNGKQIPSRIPLSAFLGGPMVGGPWPAGDQTPLSVSREFFHKVCPNPTVLPTSDINTDDVRFNDDIPASYIFERWVEKINAIDDPCLMFDSNSSPIFEFWIYGNKKRMLSIWPYLSRSPVSMQWGWSSLVEDAFRRNFHPLESRMPSFLRGISNVFREENSSLTIPGLLAIHIRRGDFKDHCVHLAKWGADWHAFNSFPEFIDKFDRPTDSGWGEASEQTIELYNRRCYPSIEQIVEKVNRVQKEAADPLRHLYIMTNGPTPWVQELKSALAQNMSWDHITSSRDLELTWEQKFVAYAVDMYIAQRAQVFIGNGWSSLTSNMVMIRMAQGYDPNTNRFW
ncbi:hypothetical protein L210DRAFT_2653848 [Boletus edulis BED1]|uniref:Uncharacterized protein n=1 Tax=Boletus edulis BED1 TaxID=1328754 RepID=A0AAD4GKJ4_BOLED|nr:hypothetical protein L210DRAFT_2653848 [Boletus edulis BED1]